MIFVNIGIRGGFLLVNYSIAPGQGINTPYSFIYFIRLLPPTSLFPRGETLFLLPLIIILESNPYSENILRQLQNLS